MIILFYKIAFIFLKTFTKYENQFHFENHRKMHRPKDVNGNCRTIIWIFRKNPWNFELFWIQIQQKKTILELDAIHQANIQIKSKSIDKTNDTIKRYSSIWNACTNHANCWCKSSLVKPACSNDPVWNSEKHKSMAIFRRFLAILLACVSFLFALNSPHQTVEKWFEEINKKKKKKMYWRYTDQF